MELIAFYKDPKKRLLQKIEIGVLVAVTPFALVWGARSAKTWSNFRQAEALFQQGDGHLHSGESKKATVAFEQSVKLCPDFYGAWEALGATYHMLGDHKKELEAYQRSVVAVPDRGELHRELATVYHETGDHKSELKHLEKAQELLGQEEIFTLRLLDRAQREAAGTYPAAAPRVAAVAASPSPYPREDPHERL